MSYKYQYNHSLVNLSKENRKGFTEAEKLLWSYLRNRQIKGYKFRRQYPILNYILDFYCVEKKLAIELDGSQHIQQQNYDDDRAKQLSKESIMIIRFWDNDVLQNPEGVIEMIMITLENDTSNKPHPDPLLRGEGERSEI